MSEKQMWSVLRPPLVEWGLDPWRIETPATKGIPDVNYLYGWIELKNAEAWPRKPEATLPLDHYTPEQRVWGLKRWRAGGLSWVLLRVHRTSDWLLFQGDVACEVLGRADKENLFASARVAVKSPSHLTLLRDVKIQKN